MGRGNREDRVGRGNRVGRVGRGDVGGSPASVITSVGTIDVATKNIGGG